MQVAHVLFVEFGGLPKEEQEPWARKEQVGLTHAHPMRSMLTVSLLDACLLYSAVPGQF